LVGVISTIFGSLHHLSHSNMVYLGNPSQQYATLSILFNNINAYITFYKSNIHTYSVYQSFGKL
jgi:hypothetical protein